MREEFALVGQDFATRGRRCDEMLEILRKLFPTLTARHEVAEIETLLNPQRMLGQFSFG